MLKFRIRRRVRLTLKRRFDLYLQFIITDSGSLRRCFYYGEGAYAG